MPWKVFKRADKYLIFKIDPRGKPIGSTVGVYSSEGDARAQQRALYANVKEEDDQLDLFGEMDDQKIPTAPGRLLFSEGLETSGQRRWFFANLGKMDYTTNKALVPVVAPHSMNVSQEHAKNWSPQEKKALHQYTHKGALWLNKQLRSDVAPGFDPEMQHDFGAQVKFMDSAIAKTTVGEPAVTYRAARDLPFDMKPGDTFTEKAYMSTSYSRDKAEEIGTADPHKKITLLRVHTSADTHAAAVDSVASNKYGIEHELILARNQKYKVFKVSDTTLHNGEKATIVDVRPFKAKEYK